MWHKPHTSASSAPPLLHPFLKLLPLGLHGAKLQGATLKSVAVGTLAHAPHLLLAAPRCFCASVSLGPCGSPVLLCMPSFGWPSLPLPVAGARSCPVAAAPSHSAPLAPRFSAPLAPRLCPCYRCPPSLWRCAHSPTTRGCTTLFLQSLRRHVVRTLR